MIINPNISELYIHAIKNGMKISNTGALLAYSNITGRSPNDKRIVFDENTKNIWWSNVNKPISLELYNIYKNHSVNYLKDKGYKICLYSCWNEQDRLKIVLYTTCPYHALFMKNMLIECTENIMDPDFTIYDTSNLLLSDVVIDEKIIQDKKLHNVLIATNFTSMDMVIYGTQYAGELKKSIFTLLMYLAPLKGNLPMHSSVNIKDNDLCIFFGLSGTGKTTLSCVNTRNLIGDDEHVWCDNGIYNIEGGCYAKCLDLSPLFEPEIYNAIKFKSVLENVVCDSNNNPIYSNSTITENTRCAYPLNFIPNVLIPACTNNHPTDIIFLTCDSFGLMPPVAKLDYDTAINFFIAGYTSKIAGTELGITEPVATFSSCFAEPFLIWHPKHYGELLKCKLNKYKPNVWLLNTGWINGPFNIGSRISIKHTRNILNSIHDKTILNYPLQKYPIFDFHIPTYIDNIDNKILDPRKWYADEKLYMAKLKNLHDKFIDKINNL